MGQSVRLRLLTVSVFAALVAAANTAASQQIPQVPPGTSAADIQRLIRQGGLGDQIRRRIQQSGLTADQIRARLRGAGYPEGLVDEYLTGDSTGTAPQPTAEVLRALSTLGFADFAIASDSLLLRDTLALPRGDSMLVDSLGLRFGLDTIPTRRDTLGNLHLDTAAAFRLAAWMRRPRVFGVDVFRRGTTQFQPALGGPVDETYRLGPGDELVLIVTGEVEVTQALPVTREGFIVIPQVGQVYVANLTMGQLTDVLYTRLGRVYGSVRRGPGAGSQFQVAIARVRVNQVFVTGEVGQPGSYPVSALATATAALYAAGGPTERANFRAIRIMRGGREAGVLDLYGYLLEGNTRGDIRLETGDVVFVPPVSRRVLIQGSVVRPAYYDLADGQNLREAIAMAGGLLAEAYTGRVQIERIIPPGRRTPGGRDRVVLDVELDSVLADSAAVARLEPDDKVSVFAVTRPLRNRVVLAGNVFRPGTFEAEPGLRLSRLITRAGGLKPDTYGQRAHILRLNPDSTRHLIPVEIGRDDPEVLEFDEITIFSLTGFRPTRQVAVYGSVQRPGVYVFRDSMTLRDAVLLAGGLRDEAYLLQAEIARLPADRRDPNELARIVQVPLDSSYVVDESGWLSRPTASRGENPVLQPYDNVYVRRVPGYELQRNVVLTGEVRFPGRYGLIRRDERLLDVITRAGGLTPHAYISGAQFFRADMRTGRVGINLDRVLREPDHRDNLVLFAGDSIHVPPFQPIVRVEGAVNSPVAVAWVPGRDAGWYVDRAGGFTRRADKRRTYVVQANGGVGTRSTRVEPGARVVVPALPADYQPINWIQILGVGAQIVTSLVTVLIISKQF